MSWAIKYWDGSNWVDKTDAVFKELVEELNGHEEATFYLPNTSDNRTFVQTEKGMRVMYGTQVFFEGGLSMVNSVHEVVTVTTLDARYNGSYILLSFSYEEKGGEVLSYRYRLEFEMYSYSTVLYPQGEFDDACIKTSI